MLRTTLRLALGFAALAIPLTTGCGDGGGAADAAIDSAPPAGGTLSLSWEIRDSGDGTTVLTCEQVGATGVRVSMIPVAGGNGDIFFTMCDPGTATTDAFEARAYNVEVKLIAGATAELDMFRMNGVTLESGVETPLGSVVFEVLPQASLEFSVDTAAEGLNCAPIPEGGAGLTNMRVELLDSGGACVPTTFEIYAPSADEPEDTYESDCMPDTVHTCIENDRTIRATIPSGRHSLMSTGLIDAAVCYTRMEQFLAAGNEMVEALQRQVMADELNPDCDP